MSAQEERSDAEYIVEQLVTEDLFTTSMSAMAGLMAQGIELEFRKLDKTISPGSLAWVSDQMALEMGGLMAEKVKPDFIAAYAGLLSPEALAGLRGFLETPGGQEFAKAQAGLVSEGAAIGDKYAGEIAQAATFKVIAMIQEREFPADMAITTQNELLALFVE